MFIRNLKFAFIFFLIYGCQNQQSDEQVLAPANQTSDLHRNKNVFEDGSYEIYYTDELGHKQGESTTFYDTGNLKEKGFYINDTIVGFYSSYALSGRVTQRVEGIYIDNHYLANQVIFYDENELVDSAKSLFVSVNGEVLDSVDLCKNNSLLFYPVVKGNNHDSVFYDFGFRYKDGSKKDTVVHTRCEEFLFISPIISEDLIGLCAKIEILSFTENNIVSTIIYKDLVFGCWYGSP